jgi:cyclic pyranopterin phosphate synthase
VNLIDAPIVAETAYRHGVSVGDPTPTLDKLNRPLRDLRLSVIDQCNFRCTYCMPRDVFGADYPFLTSAQRLSFEQMVKLAKAFAQLGVEKIRITGGEPLLRRGLESLIEQLAKLTTLSGKPMELALTTNGSLLAAKARSLRDAGLGRVTVSLDAVDDAVFRRMSDVDIPVSRILEGIEAARAVGLAPIKVNAVVERGVNDSQILPLVRLFKGTGVAVRFIEFMDVGGAGGWSNTKVITARETREIIESEFPLVPIVIGQQMGTAVNYRCRRSRLHRERIATVLRFVFPRPRIGRRSTLFVPLRHPGHGPQAVAHGDRLGRATGRGRPQPLDPARRPLLRASLDGAQAGIGKGLSHGSDVAGRRLTPRQAFFANHLPDHERGVHPYDAFLEHPSGVTDHDLKPKRTGRARSD